MTRAGIWVTLLLVCLVCVRRALASGRERAERERERREAAAELTAWVKTLQRSR